MNTISYCLFGDDPMYHVGAIRNAEDAKWMYPDWEVRVYTPLAPDHKTVKKLTELGATVVHTEKALGPFTQKLDRLGVILDDAPATERFMMRDVDSRFTSRELAAVHEWSYSNKRFHVMRDHPAHHRLMMAGMWGGPKGLLRDLKPWVEDLQKTGRCDELETDQQFLAEFVWPRIKDDCLQHDSCLAHVHPGSQPFPTRIADFRFIGEQIDEHERPKYPGSWKQRWEFVTKAFGIYS